MTSFWGKQFSGGLMAGGSSALARADKDMVYQTSPWHRYLWGSYEDTTPDAMRAAEEGKNKLPRWPAWMREMFTRLYSENPQQIEEVAPDNSWAQRAHELAQELPEFDRLRDRCMGDKLWSGMSATALSQEVLDAMPKPDEPLGDTNQFERAVRGMESLQKSGVPIKDIDLKNARQRLQDAQAALERYSQQIDDGAIRQALRRGVEQANSDINEAVNTMSAFGWGDDQGGDGRGGDLEQKREIMKRVGSSDKLKKLAELAGRMRRIAARKQRSKISHVRDEISNITRGDDLARLLPSELVKLSSIDTEFLFYKDMVDRSLLCYELKGTEKAGRGPIIVCVDNSGSMMGPPELWSKAVALALLDIAKKQKRTFALIHFDTKVQCRLIWESGPNPPEWGAVMKAMEFFSGGGTNFEPPLKNALELIAKDKFNKADVVLVTDGMASTAYADEYRRKAKERETTTYGVMIGADPGALSDFAEQTFRVDEMAGESSATDALFEI